MSDEGKTKKDLTSILELKNSMEEDPLAGESALSAAFISDISDLSSTEMSPEELSNFNTPMEPLSISAEQNAALPDFNLPPMSEEALSLASEATRALPKETVIPTLDALDEARLEEKTAIFSPAEAEFQSRLSSPPPSSGQDTLKNVKNYSEKLAPVTQSLAQTPFTLRIKGRLKVYEKEKFLSIINRENLGIREVELEPQFDAGHILIPQISEYVGILLVQALRNAQVEMFLGPAHEIFPNSESLGQDDLIFAGQNQTGLTTQSGAHPAQEIPLTLEPMLPGRSFKKVIDTFTVSVTLKSAQLESPHNTALDDAIEGLKSQLRQMAYYRKANALLSFRTQVIPLRDETQVKVLAQAVAAELS